MPFALCALRFLKDHVMDDEILRLLRSPSGSFFRGGDQPPAEGEPDGCLEEDQKPEGLGIRHRSLQATGIPFDSIPRPPHAIGDQTPPENKMDGKEDPLFSDDRLNQYRGLPVGPPGCSGRGDRHCRIAGEGERKARKALGFSSFPESLSFRHPPARTSLPLRPR